MSTQRTIKFRAWTGESMVSPEYITRDGLAFWKENSIPNLSDKVMQYIGLNDKDGREIYEGDIPDGIWVDNVIKWCDHCHGWSLGVAAIEGYCHQCEGDIMWLDFVADVVDGNISIAGNIYENPELIQA